MKLQLFIGFLCILFCVKSYAQLTTHQQHIYKELQDTYKGVAHLSQNRVKGYKIYKQLQNYSGKSFYVIEGQTFNWGQAHTGGLIILDYSTLEKPEDILAFKFAHEWGHQDLGHQANIYSPNGGRWRFINSPSTTMEDQADYYAGQFLAVYNYDIDEVIDYLNEADLPGGAEHSSSKIRARKVLDGYKSKKPIPIKDKYTVVRCSHALHSIGDIDPCNHEAHPRGDIGPCEHLRLGYYGYYLEHPNGDLYPCTHPAHPNGDISPCTHPIHPNGDRVLADDY